MKRLLAAFSTMAFIIAGSALIQTVQNTGNARELEAFYDRTL